MFLAFKNGGKVYKPQVIIACILGNKPALPPHYKDKNLAENTPLALSVTCADSPLIYKFLSLDYLKLMLRRSAAYGMFKKYLTGEMLSNYRSLGFVTKKSDPIDDISLRQNIVKWMCDLDYEDCTVC